MKAMVLFASLCLMGLALLGEESKAIEFDELVKQLGDDDWYRREDAQRKLMATGTASRPAVEAALSSKDPEIQARAELIFRKCYREPFRKVVCRVEAESAELVGEGVAAEGIEGQLLTRGPGNIVSDECEREWHAMTSGRKVLKFDQPARDVPAPRARLKFRVPEKARYYVLLKAEYLFKCDVPSCRLNENKVHVLTNFVEDWTWITVRLGEESTDRSPQAVELDAGEHTLEISATMGIIDELAVARELISKPTSE